MRKLLFNLDSYNITNGVKAAEFLFIVLRWYGDSRQSNLKGHNFWLYSPCPWWQCLENWWLTTDMLSAHSAEDEFEFHWFFGSYNSIKTKAFLYQAITPEPGKLNLRLNFWGCIFPPLLHLHKWGRVTCSDYIICTFWKLDDLAWRNPRSNTHIGFSGDPVLILANFVLVLHSSLQIIFVYKQVICLLFWVVFCGSIII